MAPKRKKAATGNRKSIRQAATAPSPMKSSPKENGQLKVIAVDGYELVEDSVVSEETFEIVAEDEFETSSPSKVTEKISKAASNGVKDYSCSSCEIHFSDAKALADHESSGHEKPLACSVCHKSFTRKYHLERHTQLTSCSGQAPPSHPCNVCGKVYTRKDNLREHLRVHAGEVTRQKKFPCQHCDKMFHGASLLKIHERTHTGEKPYACDFCDKSFPSGGALTKHRRIHTGEKPYACPHCEIRFSLKGTLNRHMRIHTGIRPHKCPYCEKSFIQAGGLKAHMFYHTGNNGFQCDECDKTFNRKARLEMHQRYVHKKDRPFVCEHETCGKKFTRKEDLNRHAVLHSGEKPHVCNVCNKSFAIKPSLKLHYLTHTKEEPRSCNECGRAFIRKDCLIRHMRKRHKEKFEQLKNDGEMCDSNSNDAADSAEDDTPRVLSDDELVDSIKELLEAVVDQPTLKNFGWPDAPVEDILESVIKRCDQTPVSADDYSYNDRLRENAKLLFTVVIDDATIKTLLNNKSVDDVILHVLNLAKN